MRLRPTIDSDNPAVLLAPLLVWAGHFLFVYVTAAIVCAHYPTAPVAPVLWLASAAALALTALIGWRFQRRLHGESAPASDQHLALRAGRLLSLIALIAIAWSTLAILLIRPCA